MSKRVLCRVPGTDELAGVTMYRDGTYRLHDYGGNKLSKDIMDTGTWALNKDKERIDIVMKGGEKGHWDASEDKTYDMVVQALLDIEIEKILK